MKPIPKILVAIILSFICLSPSFAQKKTGTFRDSVDGAFDISKFLFDLHGFLPIISPITEPALGYGLVGVGVYFIPKKKTDPNEFRMPDIVGLAGGYTQNGTWLTGGGYIGFWKEDRIRYRGILGFGSINMNYYGSGEYLSDDPKEFNMESLFFLQQAIFRINNSNFFLGGKYVLAQTDIAFEQAKPQIIDTLDFDLVSSGIGIIGEYESFNNVLSPSKGVRIHLSYNQFLEFLGSDKNNSNLTFFSHAYLPLSKRWTAGIRLESTLASDNTPFYTMPYINLRGVPMLRYQGQLSMLAETEHSVNVYRRWSMVGFTGIGTTFSSLEDMTAGPVAWNAGAGFRYMIARLLGLQMGVDFARGPEDWAFYIVVGSAWMK